VEGGTPSGIQPTSLHALIKAILLPFAGCKGREFVSIVGPDMPAPAIAYGKPHAIVARFPGTGKLLVSMNIEMALNPGGIGAGVNGDDGIIGHELVQLIGDHLRLHWFIAALPPPNA
jgi:hypothetical protein